MGEREGGGEGGREGGRGGGGSLREVGGSWWGPGWREEGERKEKREGGGREREADRWEMGGRGEGGRAGMGLEG